MNSSKRQGAKRATKRKTGLKKNKNKANALSRNPAANSQPTGFSRGVTKGVRGTGLSKCAEIYAKALVNPFGEFDELPCVPTAPADMTYKFRHIVRGSFSTSSTTGAGFVCWAPMCASNSNNSIFYSGSNWGGVWFALSGIGISQQLKANLPYGNSLFTASLPMYARLVSSGLRVKNTTAPLYRQGSILAARMQTGLGLNSTTPGSVQASLETVKEEAGRPGWFNWNYIPQDQEDLDFPDGPIDYSLGRSSPNFGILVQGANLTNVSTFDYEIVEFWEFQSANGGTVVPSLSKTHADTVGLDRIVEAVSVPVQTLNLKDQAQHVAENAIDAMAHSDSAAKTVEDLLGLAGLALPTVEKLVGSMSSMLLH